MNYSVHIYYNLRTWLAVSSAQKFYSCFFGLKKIMKNILCWAAFQNSVNIKLLSPPPLHLNWMIFFSFASFEQYNTFAAAG